MKIIGRTLEELSIDERIAAAGQWAAIQIYTPQTLPPRTIVALGRTIADCTRQLRALGLDPGNFEFILITSPFA
jgi:hypothetical protein